MNTTWSNMNPISPKILKLLFLLIFIAQYDLKSGEVILNSPKINLSKLYESLGEENKKEKLPLVKHSINKKHLFAKADENGCSLVLTQSFGTVKYFSVSCGGKPREGLIHFAHSSRKGQIPEGFFRLIGIHKIGTKNYIEISLGNTKFETASVSNNKDDTEFQYIRSPFTGKSEKKEIYRELKNPNLIYFRTIAYDKNRRKEAPSNLEVFFDESCPIVFLEKDESFYWDKTISYVFQISCVKDTPYALARIPGNSEGRLVVSDQISRLPEKGERFYAKLRMRKITNEQAFWEESKLYYE